jgi:hypothetical protein
MLQAQVVVVVVVVGRIGSEQYNTLARSIPGLLAFVPTEQTSKLLTLVTATLPSCKSSSITSTSPVLVYDCQILATIAAMTCAG